MSGAFRTLTLGLAGGLGLFASVAVAEQPELLRAADGGVTWDDLAATQEQIVLHFVLATALLSSFRYLLCP